MVVEKLNGEVYKLLLEYAFEKCDEFVLSKRLDYHYDKNQKIRDIFLADRYFMSNLNNDKEFLYNYLIDKYFDLIGKLCIDDILNWNDSFAYPLDIYKIESLIQFAIMNTLEWIVYENNVNTFLKFNKDNIKIEKKCYSEDGKKLLLISYVFKINDEIKQVILNVDNLFDWCFPNTLEDLSFLRNGNYLMFSVAHEKICEIYCENEEEYEYFKSIGITFSDNDYIPIVSRIFHYD